MKQENYSNYIKPAGDYMAALLLLFLLLPVFILVSSVLLIFHNGDVFFIQWRPGKYGKLFQLLKFKTMKDAKDGKGNLLPDEQRLTKIGRFIRKTSLDELPQLINILRGEMSFIGPRPLLKEYLLLYTAEQARRHLVKPGITGWAQVNGRNNISWQKKFELDTWYVANLSLKVDMKIIIRTIKNVVSQKDINEVGEATASPFMGNKITNQSL